VNYREYIKQLSLEIPEEIVNLKIRRRRGTVPTQAFSDFLTHSEQGDWAEILFFNTLKKTELPYVPVRYGKSDKITAGDSKFKEFYNSYQDELDSIGKKPDILLFKPEHYKTEWGDDITKLPSAELQSLVPQAVAAFEVRSSAYLTRKFVPKPTRPFLSFTPKVEDLLLVLKWIDTYGVPHFYVQVFFDSVYIISFNDILLLLKTAKIEKKGKKNIKILGKFRGNPVFVIEKNPKNQYKETIHIYLNRGTLICSDVESPKLLGNKKELPGGRLLHYVSFEASHTQINREVLLEMIHNSV